MSSWIVKLLKYLSFKNQLKEAKTEKLEPNCQREKSLEWSGAEYQNPCRIVVRGRRSYVVLRYSKFTSMVTFSTKKPVWRRKWKGVCTVNSNNNYVGVKERHLYCTRAISVFPPHKLCWVVTQWRHFTTWCDVRILIMFCSNTHFHCLLAVQNFIVLYTLNWNNYIIVSYSYRP